MTIDIKTLRLAEAAHRDSGHDATADLLRNAADTIDAQATEIKRLRARLEINPKAPEIDGIYCRDVTISGQDKLIDELRAKNKQLREALEAIEKWESPVVESRGEAVSMSVVYGSNGVRDYFRGVARAALQGESHGQA